MKLDDNVAIYPISVAAKFLEVHTRTLIKYENEGLIKPARNPQNNHRLFSKTDLQWIECIRKIVHKEGINLKSIKYMLTRIPCWSLKRCRISKREKCSAFKHFTKPCWEILDGICQKDSKAKCETCNVFKAAKENKEFVTRNISSGAAA